MSIPVRVNEVYTFEFNVDDGNENLFPKVHLYDESKTEVFSSNMSHNERGIYYSDSTYTITTTEKFKALYIVYEDAARTIESLTYPRSSDVLVSDADPNLVASGS